MTEGEGQPSSEEVGGWRRCTERGSGERRQSDDKVRWEKEPEEGPEAGTPSVEERLAKVERAMSRWQTAEPVTRALMMREALEREHGVLEERRRRRRKR